MSKNKIIGAFLVVTLCVFALSTSKILAQDENEMNEKKEWNLLHPKAKDPNAYPSPDETSVDLSRLQEADSLREIYDLASDMSINSVSDQRVLSRAVGDYLKLCCEDYDIAINEIKKSGFEKITDVTDAAKRQKEQFLLQHMEFDMVVFSQLQARINLNLLKSVPSVTHYKIYLIFNNKKLKAVKAYIHDSELL